MKKLLLILFCLCTVCAWGQKTRPAMSYETSISGQKDGYDYVDLGLSVKWATRNVGAETISDFGGLYAWGCTTVEDYDWESYPHQDYKTFVGGMTLPPEHDAAQQIWGGAWRMPTYKEFKELKERCKWNWVQYNGTWGCKVVGPNGRCIFLPAAGSTAGDFNQPNEQGMYWSATILDQGPNTWGEHKRLRFRKGLVSLAYSHGPQVSMSIRPVFK